MTERTREIIERLLEKWPEPKLELEYSNAVELLIATILAAQCTDRQVNEVTKTLFVHYPTAQSIANEDTDVLAEKIRATGFYRNKAKSLIACCQRMVQDHGGAVPDTIEQLTKLPGVGRKTANIVLGNAFDVQTIAVDTHLKRVSARLDLSNAETIDQVEEELTQIVDEQYWTVFTNLMILHGRYTCQSRRPKCPWCNVNDICNWEGKIPSSRDEQRT